jgi:ABC-type multidrug transport system fused ATPase/permease subunit
MGKGKILEVGSHQKLMDLDGKYSQLVSSYIGGKI